MKKIITEISPEIIAYIHMRKKPEKLPMPLLEHCNKQLVEIANEVGEIALGLNPVEASTVEPKCAEEEKQN